jgi:hypothetical protein
MGNLERCFFSLIRPRDVGGNTIANYIAVWVSASPERAARNTSTSGIDT